MCCKGAGMFFGFFCQALKLYAWEQSFHDRIQKVREQEIATLLKISMLYVVTGTMWSLAGFLVSICASSLFSSYVFHWLFGWLAV